MQPNGMGCDRLVKGENHRNADDAMIRFADNMLWLRIIYHPDTLWRKHGTANDSYA